LDTDPNLVTLKMKAARFSETSEEVTSPENLEIKDPLSTGIKTG
jgi:hypothetical protein